MSGDNSRLNWKRQQFEKLVKQVWRLGFKWGVTWMRYNLSSFLRENGQSDLADRLEKLDVDDIMKREADRVRGEVFEKAGIDLAKASFELMR